jgi:hypothetical protein
MKKLARQLRLERVPRHHRAEQRFRNRIRDRWNRAHDGLRAESCPESRLLDFRQWNDVWQRDELRTGRQRRINDGEQRWHDHRRHGWLINLAPDGKNSGGCCRLSLRPRFRDALWCPATESRSHFVTADHESSRPAVISQPRITETLGRSLARLLICSRPCCESTPAYSEKENGYESPSESSTDPGSPRGYRWSDLSRERPGTGAAGGGRGCETSAFPREYLAPERPLRRQRRRRQLTTLTRRSSNFQQPSSETACEFPSCRS